MNNILLYLSKYDKKWCTLMGYNNPYIDPFDFHLTNKMPYFDISAYNKYPEHNWVYDKLIIAQTQGIICGLLDDLKNKKIDFFPIFIKPRWGHKSASSKNCHHIKSQMELNKYKYLPNMIWTDFINGLENMTDFILVNGKIMHQITYKYSTDKNGFSDVSKYISPENKPPMSIITWTNIHMNNYTGIVNIQYINDTIIEVGLRLARGGAYITSTTNKALIQNINNVIETNTWDFSIEKEMSFVPFYSFKCFTSGPIFYLLPQHIITYILKLYKAKPFYEYYFEPVGKNGYVFFNFLHDDYAKGIELKKLLEKLLPNIQRILILMLIISIYILLQDIKIGIYLLMILLALYFTRYLNPILVSISLMNKYK